MSDFDKALEEILSRDRLAYSSWLINEGEWDPSDTEQAIKQAMEKHIIGEDEDQTIHLGEEGFIAMQRTVGRNQQREQQRQALYNKGEEE